MRYTFLALSVVVIISACRKDKEELLALWNCEKSQNLDTVTISSGIIGEWKWSKQACGDGAALPKSADRNVLLKFTSDRLFTVSENGSPITQGTWKLVQHNSNFWSLQVSPSSDYLLGRISLCDQQVLFSDSDRDGCDNLFTRNN